MIDNLVLLLTHTLLMITAWRLWNNDALDDDSRDTAAGAAPTVTSAWGKKGWNRPRA